MSRWTQLGLALILAAFGAAYQASGAVVRAVLFYSPTCPHCQWVITQALPPIMADYQDQLQIVAIDITSAGGHQLYEAAIQAFGIPEERQGVPTLILGTTVLVGSSEIPNEFPGLIEAGMARGGIDWPDIPGLKDALPAGAATVPIEHTSKDLWARASRDLPGHILALAILLGSLGAIGWSLGRWFGLGRPSRKGIDARGVREGWRGWTIPALSLAGAAVSIYLSYIETTGSLAVCGPIGDCNAVQQSEYARLFGLIPIGVLGVIGYAMILGTHVYRARWPGKAGNRPAQVLFALALVGTSFSVYLTFLEIFVIGAVCLWCLSSAVLMALLLLAIAGDPELTSGRPRLPRSSPA